MAASTRTVATSAVGVVAVVLIAAGLLTGVDPLVIIGVVVALAVLVVAGFGLRLAGRPVGNAGEQDAPTDRGAASSRATGGGGEGPGDRTGDVHSTTGTTSNEEFVGRVSGADPGMVGETGAEARARREP